MNSIGRIFRVAIFGESHGEAVGVTIDGVPSGLSLSPVDFIEDLGKRKTGIEGTSKRLESDLPLILSGVFNGFSTGAPLTVIFRNENQNSNDYSEGSKYLPRPSHSDFAYFKKFRGYNDYRGGGCSSGRLTLALVTAGVVAKKIIPYEISSRIKSIKGEEAYDELVRAAAERRDSIGGIIETTVRNVPAGIGEPFFFSLESYISQLVFSIPGAKGIEFGVGFEASNMLGSEFNDSIIDTNGTSLSNNAGGINGGVSNGNNIVFRVAYRPTASIGVEQDTIDLRTGEKAVIAIQGRHDVCYALRVPIVQSAATAIALADMYLLSRAYNC